MGTEMKVSLCKSYIPAYWLWLLLCPKSTLFNKLTPLITAEISWPSAYKGNLLLEDPPSKAVGARPFPDSR